MGKTLFGQVQTTIVGGKVAYQLDKGFGKVKSGQMFLHQQNTISSLHILINITLVGAIIGNFKNNFYMESNQVINTLTKKVLQARRYKMPSQSFIQSLINSLLTFSCRSCNIKTNCTWLSSTLAMIAVAIKILARKQILSVC